MEIGFSICLSMLSQVLPPILVLLFLNIKKSYLKIMFLDSPAQEETPPLHSSGLAAAVTENHLATCSCHLLVYTVTHCA